LDQADSLRSVNENQTRVIAGIVLMLVSSAAVIGFGGFKMHFELGCLEGPGFMRFRLMVAGCGTLVWPATATNLPLQPV
jgi:hypothetical protein